MRTPRPGEQHQLLDIASGTPWAAVTVFFEPGTGGGDRTFWIPTQIDDPRPLPGVTRLSRPWERMGRMVVSTDDAAMPTLEGRLRRLRSDFGVHPTAALWALPINTKVGLACYAGESERWWFTYTLADAVDASRLRGDLVTTTGESAGSIPIKSPEHDPRGANDHQLLRIPASNPFPRSGSVPGERVGIDEWFAAPQRGFVLLIREAGAAGWYYRLTTNLKVLQDPNRASVELVAVFDSITDARLAELAEALWTD